MKCNTYPVYVRFVKFRKRLVFCGCETIIVRGFPICPSPYTVDPIVSAYPLFDLMLSDIEDHELYESPSKSKRASPIASPGQPYFMRNFNVILNHVLLNSYNHLLFTKEDMLAIENFTKLQG